MLVQGIPLRMNPMHRFLAQSVYRCACDESLYINTIFSWSTSNGCLTVHRELVDIVSMAIQYVLWNDLRANGLFVNQVRIGGEQAEPYANDFVYNTSISLSTLSEWRVEIPIENIVEKL